MQLRLIEPTGYSVPGGIRTATPDTEARTRAALKALAVEHAKEWADFGYHPTEYRILTDPDSEHRFVVQEHGPRDFWVYDTATCRSYDPRFTRRAAQESADRRNRAVQTTY